LIDSSELDRRNEQGRRERKTKEEEETGATGNRNEGKYFIRVEKKSGQIIHSFTMVQKRPNFAVLLLSQFSSIIFKKLVRSGKNSIRPSVPFPIIC
jgi:acetylglutamate synthase